ncbi:MAG: PQQ-dependent sugar dehydrogenase [Planctomycetota bacterium]
MHPAYAAALTALAIASTAGATFVVELQVIPGAAPSEPTFLNAPVGDADYFYTGARKNADIWIHDRETGQRIGTFLNLPNAATAAEDGLLSMAFHPDFATNGLFYTYVYRNSERLLRITEHRRSTTDPLVADPSYSRQIYQMPNSNSHNGGWLDFSPVDGYLYFTTGDGGANQRQNNGLPSQDLFDPHGKLHRVDVSGDDFPADDDFNFGVPADNPFAAGGGLPEVYAYGLRHPWRGSFDRANGDLYLGDVGGVQFEEVNRVPAGEAGLNFGWRVFEGLDPTTIGSNDPIPPNVTDPFYSYPHAGGAAITGGHVYRGTEHPEMQGTYFHADYIKSTIGSFDVTTGVPTEIKDRTAQMFGSGGERITAIGADGLGELYMLSFFSQDIYRITSFVPPPIDGDYNQDGVVDLSDYTVWRDAVGQPAGTLPNDPDGGVIGEDQYQTWIANFGTDATPVPEPATLGWLAVLAVSAVHGHRQR